MPDQDPAAKIIQCHKCQKRLKYNGEKPYITCPNCGESVPVADNLPDDDSVLDVVDAPPVNQSSEPEMWHVARGDERFGPFTNEQLMQGISSGRISANDFL